MFALRVSVIIALLYSALFAVTTVVTINGLASVAAAAAAATAGRFYTILGVPRDADESTIKSAYRKLAMKVR